MEYLLKPMSEQEYLLKLKIERDYYFNLRAEQIINATLCWHGGKVGNYRFEVNVLKKRSKIGIDFGKIFKLCVWDSTKGMVNGCVAYYHNGWDIKPYKELEPYVNQILRKFN